MFAEEYRGSCRVYMDPMNFPPKVLELFKQWKFGEPGEWEEWLEEFEGDFSHLGLDHEPTMEEAFNNPKMLDVIMGGTGSGIDGAVVFDKGSSDGWIQTFFDDCGLVHGGEYELGIHDGEAYYLIEGD